jgi:hypothetical protein
MDVHSSDYSLMSFYFLFTFPYMGYQAGDWFTLVDGR